MKNEKSQIASTPHIFNYEGKNITFALGNGDVMVNATQMAKAFSKRPAKWLELSGTQEFLKTLSCVRKKETSDIQLITSIMGSSESGGGTWMHEDVALEFARWLSPKFAIWCNDQIKTLLKHGVVATDDKIEEFLANPDLAIQVFTALKQERERSRTLESRVLSQNGQIQLLENEIDKTKPIVKTYNEIMDSEGLLTTTQVAKSYGWSAKKLNALLHNLKIQYKQNGQWLLYWQYHNKEYTKSVTHTYTKNDGKSGAQQETKWTHSGRVFIHNQLKEKGLID